jgi:hypothetical protein
MTRYQVVLTLTAAILLNAGCRNQPAATGPSDAEPIAAENDHHHGTGPHGGTIADWGAGDYHVEFTVDHDKHEAVVYILGSDALAAAPVKADELLLSLEQPLVEIIMQPMPLENEPTGMSSRFVGQHEALAEVREFAGTISGVVDGTPYAGDFNEESSSHQH